MNTTNSTRTATSSNLFASFKKTALNRGVAAALLAAVAGTAAHAAPVSVAILNGSSGSMSMASVAAQLNDDSYFDFTASVVQGSAISTAADLSSYNVVLLGGSGYSNTEYSASTLAAVRAFMQAGGGVVTAGWYRYGAIAAADQTSADAITPVVTGQNYDYVTSSSLVINTSHAITTAVGNISVSGCCIEVASALDVGATALATASGQTAVAYQDTIGRSVYLGLLYSANASGYNNAGLRTGNADRLLEQSVNWAASKTLSTTANATVPEPGSLALVAAAVAGLAVVRRRA